MLMAFVSAEELLSLVVLCGFMCNASPNSGCFLVGVEIPVKVALDDPAQYIELFFLLFCRHWCVVGWHSADCIPILHVCFGVPRWPSPFDKISTIISFLMRADYSL